MKNIKTIILGVILMTVSSLASANNFGHEVQKDTVVIELENGSKIVIHTKNKYELRKLQAYDINEMIRDLNSRIKSSDVDYMELETGDGRKYIIDSPTVIYGERTAEGDTLVITEKALDNIKIKVGGMELSVDPDEIEDFDEDDFEDVKKYSYVRRSESKNRSFFNMDIGTNNWIEDGNLPSITDAAYSVKPWGSWYIGINWLNDTKIVGPLYLEWGGGFSWYNWKLEDADVMITKGDDMIEFAPSTEEVEGIKSKLSATYLNASIVPVFDFGRGRRKVRGIAGEGFSFNSSRRTGLRIGAGVYGGYRIGSKTKFRFKDGGTSDRIKEKDHFYLNTFRYGIRGQIGIGSFDMFILYDLNEVFADGRGPNGAELNAFTIGITL